MALERLGLTAHDVISQRLLLPLSAVSRRIRPGTRDVMRAFDTGLRFRRESAHWSEDERRQWVLNRLRAVVRTASAETRYYRELFKRIGFDAREDFDFDTFARLPTLERSHIRDDPSALLSDAIPSHALKKDATGGSTGVPTEVWLGPEERGWRESGITYYMTLLRAGEGQRTALLWGHHLDPKASDSLRDRLYAFKTNVRWFDCFRMSPAILDRYHAELQRYQPACIVAYASALGSFAEHLQARRESPTYPTQSLVTGAEKLIPRHREVVEQVFGRPVQERYGGRDVGAIAHQLTPGVLDYHIDWANFLVEPDSTEPQAAILVTKLHADGMPMIRYRIGDLGHFPTGSQPGHPAFVLKEILGRDTGRIWLDNQQWISGNQIPHMMKDYPVREFMFIQRGDFSIELLVVAEQEFPLELQERLVETVQQNLPRLSIKLSVVDEIPRTRSNKWHPVVSEVSVASSRTQ